jgi:hypothetical protein
LIDVILLRSHLVVEISQLKEDNEGEKKMSRECECPFMSGRKEKKKKKRKP